ncbi:hypothetical protein BT63DRAFT_415910 [Microthyrium microscopicum]|uniref:BTB domain-containing protein n=1 Tax=Microthyrium microscopicum TaxID=703497 RepID=A0A6A6U5F2_9PEZI|nr:hypothetical protein BT63DRAFT_415910 [Microthyrium microscopicum]
MPGNLAAKITIEVSERTFVTTKQTLMDGMAEGSGYFRAMFDLGNRLTQGDSDGTEQSAPEEPLYFDFDSKTFSHILDYLKTGVMPFLWTRERGFDYISYVKIERLADYLQIPGLRAWLKNNEFEEVVSRVRQSRVTSAGVMVYPSDGLTLEFVHEGKKLFMYERGLPLNKAYLLND